MADWKFLNEKARCKEPSKYVPPQYCSTPEDGFNGMFRFTIDGKLIRVIASDGMDWQHVSVSIEFEQKCPTWKMMCEVKELFF